MINFLIDPQKKRVLVKCSVVTAASDKGLMMGNIGAAMNPPSRKWKMLEKELTF